MIVLEKEGLVYSGTSEERTIWKQRFCPLFGGCPYLGGSQFYCIYNNW